MNNFEENFGYKDYFGKYDNSSFKPETKDDYSFRPEPKDDFSFRPEPKDDFSFRPEPKDDYSFRPEPKDDYSFRPEPKDDFSFKPQTGEDINFKPEVSEQSEHIYNYNEKHPYTAPPYKDDSKSSDYTGAYYAPPKYAAPEYAQSKYDLTQNQIPHYAPNSNDYKPVKKSRSIAKAIMIAALICIVGGGSLGIGLQLASTAITNSGHQMEIADNTEADYYTDLDEIFEFDYDFDVPDSTEDESAFTILEPSTPQDAQPATEDSNENGLDIESGNNAYSRATYGDMALTESGLITNIYKTVSPSVVSIIVKVTVPSYFNRSYSSDQAGSGIIFKQDEEKVYIVTNYHVINGANGTGSVKVSIDDLIQVNANYIGGNESNDIAVISVNKKEMTEAGITDYKIAQFADSDSIEIGNIVVAIGNALGEGKSATYGIISAINKEINIENQILSVIQTDAAINPGNSGGALANAEGKVVGINTAKLSSMGVEGMGYAIPSNVLNEIVSEIMGQKKVETPYLGVEVVTIDERLRQINNLPATGVYLNNVQTGTSAEDAGLRRGDLITAINGRSITTAEELSKTIESSKVGDRLEITIIRDRQQISITAALKSKGFNF